MIQWGTEVQNKELSGQNILYDIIRILFILHFNFKKLDDDTCRILL